MDARTTMAAGLLVVAVALAGGCESGPVSPEQESWSESLPAALVVPSGAQGSVTVCKDGPENRTYSFGVSTGQDLIGFPYGNRFTLLKDECKTVAVATRKDQPRRFVTLVEYTPPAGTRFWKVEVWNYGTISKGGQTLRSTSYSNTPITVGPFGGDNGWVVVYYNTFVGRADGR